MVGREVINGQKMVVVLPAYNTAKTVVNTWREITVEVAEKVLVDDGSRGNTADFARQLGIHWESI